MKNGLLMVNLGTPESPDLGDVRRYLREFLSDPRVIDLPFPLRWFLLNLFILPFRPRRSARAYASIWTAEGSPLKVQSLALERELSAALEKEDIQVVLAMRYGTPTIRSGLRKLHEQKCERLIILPLFPQYSSSTTGSILETVYREASRDWNNTLLQVVPSFYEHPQFIQAFVERGKPYLEKNPDHVLFSFHGLPERHLLRGDKEGHGCLKREECCIAISEKNRDCYRAQCFRTAELIACGLTLKRENWSVSFQSRLGRGNWIKPYTEGKLRELVRGGTRKLLVFCPAFVSDCLETLEEIAIRGNSIFHEEGGESLDLVQSLNADPFWVNGLVRIVHDAVMIPKSV